MGPSVSFGPPSRKKQQPILLEVKVRKTANAINQIFQKVQGVPKKIGFSEMRHFIYKLKTTCSIVLMIRKFKTSLLRTFKFIV